MKKMRGVVRRGPYKSEETGEEREKGVVQKRRESRGVGKRRCTKVLSLDDCSNKAASNFWDRRIVRFIWDSRATGLFGLIGMFDLIGL